VKQVWLPLQTLPQPAQLLISVRPSVQFPLQQSGNPPLQEVVQFPQKFGSELVSTQVPLQQVPEQQSEF
jgi:hypothetical protein